MLLRKSEGRDKRHEREEESVVDPAAAIDNKERSKGVRSRRSKTCESYADAVLRSDVLIFARHTQTRRLLTCGYERLSDLFCSSRGSTDAAYHPPCPSPAISIRAAKLPG